MKKSIVMKAIKEMNLVVVSTTPATHNTDEAINFTDKVHVQNHMGKWCVVSKKGKHFAFGEEHTTIDTLKAELLTLVECGKIKVNEQLSNPDAKQGASALADLQETLTLDSEANITAAFFLDEAKGLELLNQKVMEGKVIRLSSGKPFEPAAVIVRKEMKRSDGKMYPAYVFTVGYGKKKGAIEQSYWLTCLLQYVKILN